MIKVGQRWIRKWENPRYAILMKVWIIEILEVYSNGDGKGNWLVKDSIKIPPNQISCSFFPSSGNEMNFGNFYQNQIDYDRNIRYYSSKLSLD